jgi:hypothetical protein
MPCDMPVNVRPARQDANAGVVNSFERPQNRPMDPTDPYFLPVPETARADLPAWHRQDFPSVARGLADAWPAVLDWSFPTLASRVAAIPVELVVGNRENGATRFARSSLRHYLASLDGEAPRAYLKEFDLLKVVPGLRGDVRHAELLPRFSLHALRSWIGPAGTGTGLHYDYLDNLAVQVLGTKRWRLVRAGAVERLGAVSGKYDPWAVLSSRSAGELAAAGEAGDFLAVDLRPGDVLRVPAGWWHETSNLTASLMIGGFFGPPPRVLARLAWVSARDLRHRLGWHARGDCTCHAPDRS